MFAALASRAADETRKPLVAEPRTQPAHLGAARVLKTARRSITGTSSPSAALELLLRSRVSQRLHASPVFCRQV